MIKRVVVNASFANTYDTQKAIGDSRKDSHLKPRMRMINGI